MEFELTIRGNTEELPTLLELLRESGGVPKLTEPDIATVIPWDRELQESLWDDLSVSARDLMYHLVMQCDDEGMLFNDDWVCNEDGFGHDGQANEMMMDYCEIDTPCQLPEDHRVRRDLSTGAYIDAGCGINAQSLGARLANIARNLSASKYQGQTAPIIKFRRSDLDHEGEAPRYTYGLQANWSSFVITKWSESSIGIREVFEKVAEDKKADHKGRPLS